MAIYLVQHGLCLSKDVDPKKSLSEKGREEVALLSAYLERLGITVSGVCHSGKTRAKQTAQIFADRIGDGNLRELSGMKPLDDVEAFAAIEIEDDMMYVGHLPHMEKLVSFLTTGDESCGVVKFTNGGVVCVEKDAAGWRIRWCLTPSLCT